MTRESRVKLPAALMDRWGAEAESLGVPVGALLTADLTRYRAMADAAAPDLDEWGWHLLAHVLSGIEGHDILSGVDDLPSARRIAAAIEEWADSATEAEVLRAEPIRRAALGWPPLAIAGVLFRLRGMG